VQQRRSDIQKKLHQSHEVDDSGDPSPDDDHVSSDASHDAGELSGDDGELSLDTSRDDGSLSVGMSRDAEEPLDRSQDDEEISLDTSRDGGLSLDTSRDGGLSLDTSHDESLSLDTSPDEGLSLHSSHDGGLSLDTSVDDEELFRNMSREDDQRPLDGSLDESLRNKQLTHDVSQSAPQPLQVIQYKQSILGQQPIGTSPTTEDNYRVIFGMYSTQNILKLTYI